MKAEFSKIITMEMPPQENWSKNPGHCAWLDKCSPTELHSQVLGPVFRLSVPTC